ncbi:DNA-binding MarR family transcriptional regulator [Keratinibaculum paraultunense]|uniref:DNA-binding MarR family transcriptional regulator n=1 Tax=Keratinibaculum paraultunense TaxID=1278232 RepID=A0A4R3KTD9_9FIRM|nr:MarR family transcriptional regulator [Keratinibaculum paraultunense]QQY78789.1 MarR family transcriptional regulator [Keratinibaculum paraultunense]TCS87503.1 DNA-binding MarR family transcriptional regulator [Keratinibaculum paraultunense]
MKDKDICENVVNIERYLRKVDYIIRLKGREILKDFNITIPQFTALQILISNGDLTIGELSQKMGLACSTITDLIDRMENNKLVVREKDKKDKRVVRVEVLPVGYEIVEKVLEERIRFLESKLKGLSQEEKVALSEGLESLYNAMKQN